MVLVEEEVSGWTQLPASFNLIPPMYVHSQVLDPSLLEVQQGEAAEDHNSKPVFWFGPQTNNYQLTTDGALRKKNKVDDRGGHGSVLRDSTTTECVDYTCGRSRYIGKILFHEAEAVEKGLEMAAKLIEMGFDIEFMNVFTDNQDLVKFLNAQLYVPSAGIGNNQTSKGSNAAVEGKSNEEKGDEDWQVPKSTLKRRRPVPMDLVVNNIRRLRDLHWPGRRFKIEWIRREANYGADFLSKIIDNTRAVNSGTIVGRLGDYLKYFLRRDKNGYYLWFSDYYKFVQKKKFDAINEG